MDYGNIDAQASPTNVKPVAPATGAAKADAAMDDIDAHASPSGPSSPNMPDYASGFIGNAIYNSTTPIRNISMAEQCPGSTVTMANNSFNDDVAQYRKGGIPESPHQTELKRVLNQAMDAKPNSDTSLVGRQDSDPKGG